MRFIPTACHYLMNFLPARDAGQYCSSVGPVFRSFSRWTVPHAVFSPQRESLKNQRAYRSRGGAQVMCVSASCRRQDEQVYQVERPSPTPSP